MYIYNHVRTYIYIISSYYIFESKKNSNRKKTHHLGFGLGVFQVSCKFRIIKFKIRKYLVFAYGFYYQF